MVRVIALPCRVLAALSAIAIILAVVPWPGETPAGAVAHGEPVTDGSYPFTVRLAMRITGPFGLVFTSVCSGALIDPSWIITAGHCFVDAQGRPVSGPVPYPTTATAGPSRNGTGVALVEVHQAPGTDIALGRLARPIPDVTPIALALAAPEVGLTLRLAGWGATGSLIPLPAARLHTGLVTIVSVADSTVGVRGLSPAPDTSACLYDSGAPYFTVEPGGARLVAVESDGPPCPHDQEETAARVDTVAAWIGAVIAPGAP